MTEERIIFLYISTSKQIMSNSLRSTRDKRVEDNNLPVFILFLSLSLLDLSVISIYFAILGVNFKLKNMRKWPDAKQGIELSFYTS